MSIFDPLKSQILIVDDDVSIIHLLSEILRGTAQITFATKGEQALKMAQANQPDLILLDISMAEMGGFEVCQQLKLDPDTKELPIIFMTAHDAKESEIKCFEAGAVDFVLKPFNPRVVLARVNVHLRLKQHAEALKTLARRDGLTGLFNRRYFDEIYETEYRRHQRHQLPLGVIVIDIDFFKKYNDSYGHLEGDEVLKRVAHALVSVCKRPGEMLARFGGEEFVALIPHIDPQHLTKLGDSFCAAVRELEIPHFQSDVSSHVTVSVGIVSAIPSKDLSQNALLEVADKTLYSAKHQGRNRFETLIV